MEIKPPKIYQPKNSKAEEMKKEAEIIKALVLVRYHQHQIAAMMGKSVETVKRRVKMIRARNIEAYKKGIAITSDEYQEIKGKKESLWIIFIGLLLVGIFGFLMGWLI